MWHTTWHKSAGKPIFWIFFTFYSKLSTATLRAEMSNKKTSVLKFIDFSFKTNVQISDIFLKDTHCFLFNNCQVIPTTLASKSYTPSHVDKIWQDTFRILDKVLH